jgi:hypothetical protein
MTDAELTQAMAELQEVVRCRCDEAYRDRGLQDPQCECDSAEAVKIVANRIKTLTKERDAFEAKLAKAVKAIEARIHWSAGGLYCNCWKCDPLVTTLAEIKGESHE